MEPNESTAEAELDHAPESERRRLSRDAEHDAFVGIEDLPTEPRHALPTLPDVEWDSPTIPDGRALEDWDMDERG